MNLYFIWIFIVVALPNCSNPGAVSGGGSTVVTETVGACPGEIEQVRHVRGETKRYLVFTTAKDSFEVPLPQPYDLSGFSVDRMEAIDQDFFLLIEYGTRIYWNKEFKFTCSEEGYRLVSITSSNFDKREPESEPTTDTLLVDRSVALRDFQLMEFIE